MTTTFRTELGISDDRLTADERAKLDRDGFCNLGKLLTDEQVRALRKRIDELVRIEGPEAGKELHREDGTNRVADLCNKGPEFDVLWTHPRLLSAARYLLGDDFKIFSLSLRAPVKDGGHQGLHTDDYFDPANDPSDHLRQIAGGTYFVCNSYWLLDDVAEDNGPPRLVPGSHRSGALPMDLTAMRAARARRNETPPDPHGVAVLTSKTWEHHVHAHPDEMRVQGKAGELFVVNGHVWHGGTRNVSGNPRRIIFSAWTRREVPQQYDQRHYLRPETAARLSPAQRWLLDV